MTTASDSRLTFIWPIVGLVGLVVLPAALAFRMAPDSLRNVLTHWEFWLLEALFVAVAITTIAEVTHLRVTRSTMAVAVGVGALATALSATVAPRTNRIFYDEQIYQGVAQNLADLRLAQMCNDGNVEYGGLQCWRGEFNKEPNAYPYLLAFVYRFTGAREPVAFLFNNVVAGLIALLVVLIGAVLFQDPKTGGLGGLVVALLPMQLWWTNTASAEPTAALFTAATFLAAVHFANEGTTWSLAWMCTLAAFATHTRPESVLVVPLIVAVILLRRPREFGRLRTWWAAVAGGVLCLPTLLHLMAVRNDNWGAPAARIGFEFVSSNLSPNAWFYLGHDQRFPVLVTLAAVLGLATARRRRDIAAVAVYFLLFWGIFIVFYAGSYYYGADVRYSVLSNVPLAVLAGAGLRYLRDALAPLFGARRALVAILAGVALQTSWYLPVTRAFGEEAWAARADVEYARQFARQLPPNSVVLTHNPSLFHLWGVSAAQLSLVQADPKYVKDTLFHRFAGGVYVHWSFWCNVPDNVQTSACAAALDAFDTTLVGSHGDRDYTYRLYRLNGPAQEAR